MALCGTTWCYVALHGSMWHYMALCGRRGSICLPFGMSCSVKGISCCGDKVECRCNLFNTNCKVTYLYYIFLHFMIMIFVYCTKNCMGKVPQGFISRGVVKTFYLLTYVFSFELDFNWTNFIKLDCKLHTM